MVRDRREKEIAPGQKAAEEGFGSHFIEFGSVEEYQAVVSLFFSLLKNLERSDVSILDAGGGNGKRYGAGIIKTAQEMEVRYHLTDIVPENLVEFEREVTPAFKKNILFSSDLADLSKRWELAPKLFDATMMTWALHWMGENHQTTLKEIYRVTKPGGLILITTLTPFDILIKNKVFYKDAMSIEEVRELYPTATISSREKAVKGRDIWLVKLDEFVKESLLENSDYYISHRHPKDVIGKKTLVGFQPHYIPEFLVDLGCELIKGESLKKSAFVEEGSDEKTSLYYLFRKN